MNEISMYKLVHQYSILQTNTIIYNYMRTCSDFSSDSSKYLDVYIVTLLQYKQFYNLTVW